MAATERMLAALRARAPWMRALAIIASIAGAPAADADEVGRYRLDAEIRPQATSEDGRYGLVATLARASQSVSTDGRYALKQGRADVGCEPFDPVFSDGFEGS